MAEQWLAPVRLRSLRVSLGTWVSLALVLAVGVGANVAVLSVLYNALAGSRPYADPDRLVVIQNVGAYHLGNPGGPSFQRPEVSGPDYRDLADHPAGFDGIGGMTAPEKVFVSAGGRTMSAWRVFITDRLLTTTRARATIGRAIDERDFQTAAPAVAMITDNAWRRCLGRDPHAVGRLLRVDDNSLAVIGVINDDAIRFLRRRTGLLDDDDDAGFVVVPLSASSAGSLAARLAMRGENRDSPMFTVVGRLRPGSTLVEAQYSLRAFGRRLAADHPESNAGRSFLGSPLSEWRNPQLSQLRTMLLAIAALTLVVAGASASNLVATDSVRRSTEMAIRWALGGTSSQLTRLVLFRTIVWTLPAALVALVVAVFTLGWVGGSRNGSEHVLLHLSLTPQLLAATLGLTLITGAVLGIVARATVRYRNMMPALREATPTASGGRRRRLVLNALLAVQVAAATSLGFVSGLLLRSMSSIAAVDLGYDAGSRFIVPVAFPPGSMNTRDEQRAYLDQALTRIRALAGVAHAGTSAAPPLSNMTVTAGGDLAFETPNRDPKVLAPIVVQFVSPWYLEALGVRLLRGRLLSQDDQRAGTPVAVIDEAFWRARRISEDPLKTGLRYGGFRLQVVGVIGAMRQSGPTDISVPTAYIPVTFSGSPATFNFVVVQPTGPASGAMEAVVHELRAVDSRVCVEDPKTVASLLAGTIITRQRTLRLLTVAAVIVLLLTVFSLAGSLGQFVESQKREIAIRKALGAPWSRTASLLTKYIGVPCTAGLLLGCAGAWSLSRTVSNQLFGVTAADPLAIAGTACGIVIFGGIAAALPLWRAGRVDPVRALRAQ